VSKATQAPLRADLWFEHYLAMGTERSIRKLAADAGRIGSSNGLDTIPPQRTLFNWSSKYGWDRRAREHDAEAMTRARTQLLKKRADLAESRVELALDHTMAFHALVRDALTVVTPILDENGKPSSTVHDDGSFTPNEDRRAATFRELSRQDIFSIIAFHNAAVATERALLAGAADRYQQNQDEQGADGPGITVLEPEAIQEMGIKIGGLVRHLKRVTEDRQADKRLAAEQHVELEEVSPAVDPDYNPDDPGLMWEEVPDDE
jgi:hypothetical protein